MSETQITVRALSAEDAAAHGAAWQDLVRNAASPNVFFTPELALPAIRHLNPHTLVLTAWRGEELIGLWPVAWKKKRFLVPLPLMVAQESYAPLATPLLRSSRRLAAAKALLRWVREQGAVGFLVPKITDCEPAARALEAAMLALGMVHDRENVHARAALLGARDFEVPANVRRRNERMRRRLSEKGELTLTVATGKNDVAPALEEFLALEQKGWKARKGNPLAAADGDRHFIEEAMATLAESGGARVVTLRLDGAPIAGMLLLSSGGRCFCFKTAYDEAYAKFSPGVLLNEDVSRILLEDAYIQSADSLADGGHSLERLWRGRLAVSDWMIGPQGGGLLYRIIIVLEDMRRALRRLARRIRLGRRA